MRIFLTGRPGIGKSQVIKEIIELLKKKRIKIAGILTPEIRKAGVREGFKIIDIASGEEGILAAVGIESTQKVSRYGINVNEIDRITNKCKSSLQEAEVIIIDEIGKMEFFSKEFIELIDIILKSNKPLIATLHRNYVEKFKKFGQVTTVTEENRKKLAKEIVENYFKL